MDGLVGMGVRSSHFDYMVWSSFPSSNYSWEPNLPLFENVKWDWVQSMIKWMNDYINYLLWITTLMIPNPQALIQVKLEDTTADCGVLV